MKIRNVIQQIHTCMYFFEFYRRLARDTSKKIDRRGIVLGKKERDPSPLSFWKIRNICQETAISD